MERVLTSAAFVRAPRMRRFLTFLVEETLAGRGARLKEYTIATEVFGKASDFQPGESAVVRVEAGRLRRLLVQYIADHAGDPLQIHVVKGSYVPSFHRSGELSGHAASPARAAADTRHALSQAWPAQERRMVTALSCGFTDTTGQLAMSDALLDALDTLHSRCAEIGNRHGGQVEASAGDRLMVYFGWPFALDDGPARALSAALEMIAQVRTSAQTLALSCRIGVATSEVITRGPTTAGTSLRAAVIGEAPARATRLQLHAPPSAILVAESTRRMTGAAFQFLSAGELDPDSGGGLAWRLLAARPNTTRFQALHAGLRSDLVGRAEERALLMSRWRLAQAGEGQALMLVGEAGMGKSRLAESVLAAVGRDGVRLRTQCSPQHGNSTLYPILQLLRTRLGLTKDSRDVEAAVGRVLKRSGSTEELDQGLLAELLGAAEADPVDMSASARKALTLKLLRRLLLGLSGARPIVLLVEDVHWADPTTLEFLRDLVEAAASAPLLVIMTSRPENVPNFPLQTNVTAIRLARLPRGDCAALLHGMPDAEQLSEPCRALILERAEGVPLYVEELAKLMLATHALDPWRAAVPESLSELLATQLDRLGASRAIAQMAAALGRTFSWAMLAQIAGGAGAGADLDAALDQLLAAGVLVRDRGDSSQGFAFRHALLRDAAYRSLHEPTRRALHAKIGDALVEAFPDVAADQPELVAHHLMEAGRAGESIPFWIDAGGRAAARYALTEGIAHLRMAREALASLDGEDNRERELSILLQLALLIRSARGYSDLELLSIYERAEHLALDLGKPNKRLEATYGLWTQAAGRGHWRRARALAEAFGQQVDALEGDTQLRIETLRLMGACDAFAGDFRTARERHLKAFELYDPPGHGPRFGFDPGATVAAYLSWMHWLLGEPEVARAYGQKALAAALAQAHPPTVAFVLCWLIFHAVCDEDVEAVARLNAQLQPLCEERECRYWQPFGSACAEWASFTQDGLPRHLDRLLEQADAFGEHYLKSCLLLLGADMCLSLGRAEHGLDLVDRASAFIAEHDERVWEAEAARMRAELLMLDPAADVSEVAALLKIAGDLAARQHAIALTRRTEQSLDRLVRRHRADGPSPAAKVMLNA
ncbi:AAA family ATPase [Caulobacter sp. CCNWLY153]|nr:AAA family ATPase [Caulobacter radicis]